MATHPPMARKLKIKLGGQIVHQRTAGMTLLLSSTCEMALEALCCTACRVLAILKAGVLMNQALHLHQFQKVLCFRPLDSLGCTCMYQLRQRPSPTYRCHTLHSLCCTGHIADGTPSGDTNQTSSAGTVDAGNASPTSHACKLGVCSYLA